MISIVIPVLNEARRLPALLAAVTALPGIGEVVIVDGGSRDGSAGLARAAAGVRVLEAPRGRASQMNAGATAAAGDVLLFLHADVGLPRNAARHVDEALRDPAVVGGAFRTWHVADERRPLWAPLLHLADVRSRVTSLPYGDQAVFVRAEVFRRLGGFPALPLMEDLAFARSLRRAGRIRTVAASVTVSGRRFIERPIFYTALVNVFPLLWRLGVPADVLSRVYRDVR